MYSNISLHKNLALYGVYNCLVGHCVFIRKRIAALVICRIQNSWMKKQIIFFVGILDLQKEQPVADLDQSEVQFLNWDAYL